MIPLSSPLLPIAIALTWFLPANQAASELPIPLRATVFAEAAREADCAQWVRATQAAGVRELALFVGGAVEGAGGQNELAASLLSAFGDACESAGLATHEHDPSTSTLALASVPDGPARNLAELVDAYDRAALAGEGAFSLALRVDWRGEIPGLDIERLGELARVLEATYDVDLARGATVSATSTSEGSTPAQVADGRSDTSWKTVDGVVRAFLELDLGAELAFDRLWIDEAPDVEPRLRGFEVHAREHRHWRKIGAGSATGHRHLLVVDPIVADRVRIVIQDASASPHVARVSLFAAPPPIVVTPSERTFVDVTVVRLESEHADAELRYTTDGSVPDESSALYLGPLRVRASCTLTARAFLPGNPGVIPRAVELRAYTADTLLPALDAEPTEAGLRYSLAGGDHGSFEALAGAGPSGTRVRAELTLPEAPTDAPFGVAWEGALRVPHDGVYAFFLTCDERSRLLIDAEVVVETRGELGQRELVGEAGLRAGWHRIEAQYLHAVGEPSFEASWRGPGVAKRALAGDDLGR